MAPGIQKLPVGLCGAWGGVSAGQAENGPDYYRESFCSGLGHLCSQIIPALDSGGYPVGFISEVPREFLGRFCLTGGWG